MRCEFNDGRMRLIDDDGVIYDGPGIGSGNISWKDDDPEEDEETALAAG